MFIHNKNQIYQICKRLIQNSFYICITKYVNNFDFMRVVLQRVKEAKVSVSGETIGAISKGILVLVGFTEKDNKHDLEWMSRKILNLRIFDDAEGKMNQSLLDIGGELLIVSQFTLFANTKKGNRPSYIRAAKPEIAVPLYEKFIEGLRDTGVALKTGRFGAMMQVSLVNDGPVTIQIDSMQKE